MKRCGWYMTKAVELTLYQDEGMVYVQYKYGFLAEPFRLQRCGAQRIVEENKGMDGRVC